VTSDVPPHGLVRGAPARLAGWVCECGRTLAGLGVPLPQVCAGCGRTTEGVAA
jgi:UDP-2-acetamido-3-amino-2,3-dideoxy-glucuronate N-acetyltransferase